MRKFRVRKWVKSSVTSEYGMIYADLKNLEPYRNFDFRSGIIMQYVGCEDINNRDIYEEDIVKTKSGSLGIIKYGQYSSENRDGKEHVGFYIDWIDNTLLRVDLGYWLDKIEVIGNVYEYY